MEDVITISTSELSFAQRRWWDISADVAIMDYQEIFLTDFFLKKVDFDAFAKSVSFLYDRHESLRTIFPLVNGQPRQYVISSKSPILAYLYHDISQLKSNDVNDFIKNIKKINFRELQNGPITKFLLIKIQDDLYNICVILHHIIADTRSVNILREEFVKVYNGFRKGLNPDLPLQKVQLSAFIAKQNDTIISRKKRDRAYWLNKLKPYVASQNDLEKYKPYRLAENRNQKTSFAYVLNIEQNKVNLIKQKSKSAHVSLSAFFYTSIALCYYVLSRHDRLLIASPFSSRFDPQVENLIGCFVGHIYLPIVINETCTFSDLLSVIYKEILNSSRHIIYGYDILELCEESIKAACNIYVNLEIEGAASPTTLPSNLRDGISPHCRVNYPFECSVSQYTDTFSIRWACNPANFSENLLPRIAKLHYEVIEEMVKDTNLTIAKFLELFI